MHFDIGSTSNGGAGSLARFGPGGRGLLNSRGADALVQPIGLQHVDKLPALGTRRHEIDIVSVLITIPHCRHGAAGSRWYPRGSQPRRPEPSA